MPSTDYPRMMFHRTQTAGDRADAGRRRRARHGMGAHDLAGVQSRRARTGARTGTGTRHSGTGPGAGRGGFAGAITSAGETSCKAAHGDQNRQEEAGQPVSKKVTKR